MKEVSTSLEKMKKYTQNLTIKLKNNKNSMNPLNANLLNIDLLLNYRMINKFRFVSQSKKLKERLKMKMCWEK